jgi:enoyl-CoA hydratase/carnithine racemase
VEFVDYGGEGSFADVTLKRPGKRNAIGEQMGEELLSAFARARQDGHTVLTLHAEPPVFCAGADLSEISHEKTTAPAIVSLMARLTDIDDLYIIAAVNGAVLGAGLGVLALCDSVVAASTARFLMPEARLGLFPGGVVAYLEALAPPRLAHALAFEHEGLTADRAERLGLVNEVVPPEELDRVVASRAEALAARPHLAKLAATAWRTRFRTPAFVDRQRTLDGLSQVPDAFVPRGESLDPAHVLLGEQYRDA